MSDKNKQIWDDEESAREAERRHLDETGPKFEMRSGNRQVEFEGIFPSVARAIDYAHEVANKLGVPTAVLDQETRRFVWRSWCDAYPPPRYDEVFWAGVKAMNEEEPSSSIETADSPPPVRDRGGAGGR